MEKKTGPGKGPAGQVGPPPARMKPVEGPIGRELVDDDPFTQASKVARSIGMSGDINEPFLGTPERGQYFLDQERRGAEAAKNSKKLPKDGCQCLAQFGFEFGAVVDKIYVAVTKWPDGYVHELMKNDPRGFFIKGPDGKNVASGFIKETSYDRFASISPCREG